MGMEQGHMAALPPSMHPAFIHCPHIIVKGESKICIPQTSPKPGAAASHGSVSHISQTSSSLWDLHTATKAPGLGGILCFTALLTLRQHHSVQAEELKKKPNTTSPQTQASSFP